MIGYGTHVTGCTVAIDWGALEDAFEADGRNAGHYLNLATGEVLCLAAESTPQPRGESATYAKIPSPTAEEQYTWLEQFTASVTNPDLRQRLAEAISGPRAFRHFKDALVLHADERSRWWRFRKEHVFAAMDAWLLASGITPLVGRLERYKPVNASLEPWSAARLREQLGFVADAMPPGDVRFLISLADFLKARTRLRR
jgi:hypothetical protein